MDDCHGQGPSSTNRSGRRKLSQPPFPAGRQPFDPRRFDGPEPLRHASAADREVGRDLGQRFYVDAELTVEPSRPLEEDSIEDTVNYGIAFSVIEKIVTGHRRFLIEALALEVAKALAARFPQIRKAEITVRKPNAPVPGVLDHVEVNVVWPE